ncbi:hypothetical protein [Polaribacter sp. NJDZ03]|nr:hypothetical protein [Polaribacter sp. NJDZ03]
MTKLDLKTTTEVKGGKKGPTGRRCARLFRRGYGIGGSDSAARRYDRICM